MSNLDIDLFIFAANYIIDKNKDKTNEEYTFKEFQEDALILDAFLDHTDDPSPAIQENDPSFCPIFDAIFKSFNKTLEETSVSSDESQGEESEDDDNSFHLCDECKVRELEKK